MFISLKDLCLSPLTIELGVTPEGNFTVHCIENVHGEISTFNREVVEQNGIKGIIL